MHSRWSELIERNWPAKILSVVAAVILFLFYQATSLEERFFSVPLSVIINEGYTAASPVPGSIRVSIRGSEENIYMILEEDIEVYADFSDRTAEGIFREPVRFRKIGSAKNIDQLEVKIEPAEVSIELEKKISRLVKIRPRISGYPAKGRELDQYILSAEEALVEGPRSHVDQLEFIETEEISLDGREADFYLRPEFDIDDPYISFPSGNSVGFQGIIKETVILKTFEDVGIIYIDLLPELYIENPDRSATIRVQGKQLVLESTENSDFSIIADCSDIEGPGIHSVKVSPIIPSGLVVLNYTPEIIDLEVQRVEEE